MKSPSALEKIEKKFSTATTGFKQNFTSNARHAMSRSPDYFVWWYTVKSVGLAVAVGLAAYYAGKANGMKDGRAT